MSTPPSAVVALMAHDRAKDLVGKTLQFW